MSSSSGTRSSLKKQKQKQKQKASTTKASMQKKSARDVAPPQLGSNPLNLPTATGGSLIDRKEELTRDMFSPKKKSGAWIDESLLTPSPSAASSESSPFQSSAAAAALAAPAVKVRKPAKRQLGEDGEELTFTDDYELPLGIFRYTCKLRYDDDEPFDILFWFSRAEKSHLGISGVMHSSKPTKDGTWRFSFEVGRYIDRQGTLNRTSVGAYLNALFKDVQGVHVESVCADPAFGRHELYA